MTNLALAISLEPRFPQLAKELVFMGGGLSPEGDNPEFVNNPRHEFNFWFDPEAAAIVLRAPWKKIVCTPTDISVKTKMTAAMVKQIEAAGTPIARYIAKFAMLTQAPTSCGTRSRLLRGSILRSSPAARLLHERRYGSWAWVRQHSYLGRERRFPSQRTAR